MKFFIYLISATFKLILVTSEAKWQLIFHDEYDENKFIDQNKWYIQNELSSCDGNYLEQIHCKTNSKKNIRLINGTLVLAAIQEKYLDKNFTSPLISTKQSFTYGRIEIRAALPVGKMLRPEFHLLPKHQKEWPKDGEIVVMTYHQNNVIDQSIHFTELNDNKLIANQFTTDENLNQFHNYILEWTQSEINWQFDETFVTRVNTSPLFNEEYNPFSKLFKLIISLGVGGTSFPKDSLTLDDVRRWNCSLLILDYVRIYEKREESSHLKHNYQSNNLSHDICNAIMPSIRPPHELTLSTNSSQFSRIISISSFLLLSLLIPSVIYLFFRVKTLQQNKRNSNYEEYNDIQLSEVNEEVPKENEYTAPNEYESINSNEYVESNMLSDNYLNFTNSFLETNL